MSDTDPSVEDVEAARERVESKRAELNGAVQGASNDLAAKERGIMLDEFAAEEKRLDAQIAAAAGNPLPAPEQPKTEDEQVDPPEQPKTEDEQVDPPEQPKDEEVQADAEPAKGTNKKGDK